MRIFYGLITILLVGMNANTAHAQDDRIVTLNLGDSAPKLRVQWLKGEPATRFEIGQVYIVEFWATWCKPCIAAIPELSSLAEKYRGKVTVIGVDVYESNDVPRVRMFTDSMGGQMNYRVAVEDSNFMQADWLSAIADMGIPRSFVINDSGKIAWIGHPKLGLKKTVSKILRHKWDTQKNAEIRKSSRSLELMDDSLQFEMVKYQEDPLNPLDLGDPDSALILINRIVREQPKLKYAPNISASTFIALLKTDPHKAYRYGKAMLASSKDPYYHIIFGNIKNFSNKLNLPPKIYLLGIRAYKRRIKAWPETADFPNTYHQIADWYWRANRRSKAIRFEHKAIEASKLDGNISAKQVEAFKLRLNQYQNF